MLVAPRGERRTAAAAVFLPESRLGDEPPDGIPLVGEVLHQLLGPAVDPLDQARLVAVEHVAVDAVGVDLPEAEMIQAQGVARELGARGLLFDLVFLDPPYAGDEIPEILAALLDTRVVTNEAVVVVESAKRHPLAPAEGFLVTAERTYGDTQITWLSPSVRRRSVDGTPQGRDRDQ